MSKVLIAALVIIGVLLVVAAVLVIAFYAINNHLVALQETCNSSWAQVDTVLQRRYDLIPNLVNTVKGYAAHEKTLLEDVTRLRSQWAAAKTTEERAAAATQLEAGLGRLILVAEQYPDLKASANFRDLQYELAGTENRIAVERQRYNDAVRAYNTAVRQFPSSWVAGVMGFKPSTAYFEAATPAREAPKVQF
jgi:LemA protein